MKHFIAALSNFANFNDRATRKQYWMFVLIYFLIAVTLVVIESVMQIPGFISGGFSLVFFIPSLAYGARRLHDTGKSGWWQLLMIIPFIGAIVLIVMFCFASKPEAAEQYQLQES